MTELQLRRTLEYVASPLEMALEASANAVDMEIPQPRDLEISQSGYPVPDPESGTWKIWRELNLSEAVQMGYLKELNIPPQAQEVLLPRRASPMKHENQVIKEDRYLEALAQALNSPEYLESESAAFCIGRRQVELYNLPTEGKTRDICNHFYVAGYMDLLCEAWEYTGRRYRIDGIDEIFHDCLTRTNGALGIRLSELAMEQIADIMVRYVSSFSGGRSS